MWNKPILFCHLLLSNDGQFQKLNSWKQIESLAFVPKPPGKTSTSMYYCNLLMAYEFQNKDMSKLVVIIKSYNITYPYLEARNVYTTLNNRSAVIEYI